MCPWNSHKGQLWFYYLLDKNSMALLREVSHHKRSHTNINKTMYNMSLCLINWEDFCRSFYTNIDMLPSLFNNTTHKIIAQWERPQRHKEKSCSKWKVLVVQLICFRPRKTHGESSKHIVNWLLFLSSSHTNSYSS